MTSTFNLFFNSIFQFLFWYHVWCFFQTLHAWLSVFMMQLMVFIYKFNAVFDLVRQYCVINVSGSCCDGAAVSHNETFQQGQWKRLKSLFILLVMFGYIAQNRCIFPYTWCLYLKQNLINIPTVFSKRLLSVFTYRVMRWVSCKGRVEALPRKWRAISSGLDSKGKIPTCGKRVSNKTNM